MNDEIPTKLRDRARLTVETYGWGELALRVLTAPLRVLKPSTRASATGCASAGS